MRLIGFVCAFTLIFCSGCDVDELDLSNVEVPNIRSILALPLGEMTYSMPELLAEITTDETSTSIDEFGHISLLYGDTANFIYPVDGTIAVNRTDTFLVANQILTLEFFESFGSGGIEFQAPEINFIFNNSLAMPMAISFGSFYATRTDATTGEIITVYLDGIITNRPRQIDSPSPDQIGTSVQSTISINIINSNIRELLEIAPTEIGFVLYGVTNYPISDSTGVLNPGAALTTVMELVLPLTIRLEEFTLPLDFIVGDEIEFDEADSVSFRLVTSNYLPFSAELDLLLMSDADTLYQVLGTQVLATPFLDRNFEAAEPEVNIANIQLGVEGVEAINACNAVRMVMRLNTPSTLNSQDIFAPILERYTLEIKLSILGRANLEI